MLTDSQKVTRPLPLIHAEYRAYRDQIATKRDRSALYPHAVGIETLVRCNAFCSFCPYPESPRKGQRMETDLFEKIIDDLTGIPQSHSFYINLSRINEPLLDDRMEQFHELIARQLPSAMPAFWSNGTTLVPGRFEWMAKFPKGYLSISLNSVRDDEHKEMMGFGTTRVFRNLDYVHSLKQKGAFPLMVQLCAPFKSAQQAAEIELFVKERWPLFRTGIRPFFVWVGGSDKGKAEREKSSLDEIDALPTHDLPCGQWFQLHVLANGRMAFCCIDESGCDGDAFDAGATNVLEMYARRFRWRSELPARSEIAGCADCVHLG